MNHEQILSMVDHTLLSQTSTWKEIKQICDDAMEYKVASVCIPPCFVKQAKEYTGDKMVVCTVIGFPNGYNTTAVKFYETMESINNGADEIDMVINIGDVKSQKFDNVLEEIKSLKIACGDKILKVIIETCLLTEEEKIKMCEIVSQSGADFIKTSTGFGGGGAILEDIELLSKNIDDKLKIKAAGGIKDFETAIAFINAGASRLGTSRLIQILK